MSHREQLRHEQDRRERCYLNGKIRLAREVHRRAVAHATPRYRQLFGERNIALFDLDRWLDELAPGWRALLRDADTGEPAAPPGVGDP